MSGESRIPYTRKVGRYAFYAACAYGFGLFCGFIIHLLGARESFVTSIIFPAFFVAFLALRDLEKNAEARGEARAKGEAS